MAKGESLIPRKKIAIYLGILITITIISAITLNIIYNSAEPVRVACIGNSITEYSGYPNELQTMLGSGYNVENFGVSASTVLVNTETPYICQTEITDAKEFLPDIAVIMLGTNDARTDHFNLIDNFAEDYKELISIIQELESNPEVFLVKPSPLFENELELQSTNLVEGIIPRIEQIANELDLTIIDVYAALENYPEYFPDGVHPTCEGATIIAEEVYEAIVLYTETS